MGKFVKIVKIGKTLRLPIPKDTHLTHYLTNFQVSIKQILGIEPKAVWTLIPLLRILKGLTSEPEMGKVFKLFSTFKILTLIF